MNDFFLNFTKILETNPKVYWSIILGIAGCMVLYIAEIIHIQTVFGHIQSQDPTVVRGILDPIVQRYTWIRYVVIVLAVLWAVFEYTKTKRILSTLK